MFHVGQKVVRVRGDAVVLGLQTDPIEDPTRAGAVYVISRVYDSPRSGCECVTLAEFDPKIFGFASDLFRPVAFDFDTLLATKPADLPLVEMDMEIEARVRELNQVWSA